MFVLKKVKQNAMKDNCPSNDSHRYGFRAKTMAWRRPASCDACMRQLFMMLGKGVSSKNAVEHSASHLSLTCEFVLQLGHEQAKKAI